MDDIDHVRHMLDAAEEAVLFSRRQSVVMLQVDRIRSLAIVYCLAVIGEAAEAVSPEFQKANPRIPWRVMANMRHRLIHPDFVVDLLVIFETTQRDLEPLITCLKAILESPYTKPKTARDPRGLV